MSKTDKQPFNINIAEIPRALDKKTVIDFLKEKLGGGEGDITVGNFADAFSKAKDEVLPYKWGVFKIRKEELHLKALKELRFVKLDPEGHPNIVSRVLPNDRNLIKELIDHPERSVCVKNVPDDWTHEILHEKFSTFGEIVSCKISMTYDEEGVSPTSNKYGFVSLKDKEQADKALEAFPTKENEVCAE